MEIQRWANQDNERDDMEGHHKQTQWRTGGGHQKHQGKGHTHTEKGAKRDHKSLLSVNISLQFVSEMVQRSLALT